MSNLEKDITTLKNEILNLKVAAQKVSSQLRTTQYTVPVELTIAASMRSTQRAIITLTPYAGTIPLLSYAVDINDMQNRRLWFVGGRKKNGDYEYEFYLTSTTNPSDTQGKKLNYNLIFTSTSQLDVNVRYEDV